MAQLRLKLPTTPSALIRLALQDLEACEKDARYYIHMGWWHSPSATDNSVEKSGCAVCAAGAIMARTLGCSPDQDLLPDGFDQEVRDALLAVDSLRVGDTRWAFEYLGIDVDFEEVGLLGFEITDYSQDPDQFKADMREYAQHLESRGF